MYVGTRVSSVDKVYSLFTVVVIVVFASNQEL